MKDQLALENRFIELKNEGKSLEEIAQLIEVDLSQVEKWNENLEEAYKEFQDIYLDKSAKIKITSKNIDNNYIANVQINLAQNLYTKPSKNDFFNNIQNQEYSLPYCVKQLRIHNFKGIKYTEINHIPVDTQWIFLTGENGFGKTSILQAIALAINGKQNEQIPINNSRYFDIAIEWLNNSKNQINSFRINSKSTPHIATYGPTRLDLQDPESQNEIGRRSTTLYSLFNTDGLMLNIESKMIFSKLEKSPKFDQIKKIFLTIIPDLHDIEVKKIEKEDKYKIFYIEKDRDNNAYEALSYNQIASGYRSIIAMVGDMYIRLSRNYPPETNVEDIGGIVIIDELDLHLHPKWQRELPGLLSKVFPKVQFIASTHSPIPFLGAPKNSVFLKVSRDNEKGIEVERLDIDVSKLTANTILTSPIFGMEVFHSVNVESVQEVRTEDSYEELKNNDEVREHLKALKDDIDFPDELFETEKGWFQ